MRGVYQTLQKLEANLFQSKSSFEPFFVYNLNKISPKSVFPSKTQNKFLHDHHCVFPLWYKCEKVKLWKNWNNSNNNNNYNNIVGWNFIYIRPILLLNLFLKFCQCIIQKIFLEPKQLRYNLFTYSPQIKINQTFYVICL